MKLLLLALIPIAARAQLALVTVDGTSTAPVGATYNFGNVTQSSTASVNFRAVNNSNASIAITALALSGSGFTLVGAPAGQPLIAPGNFLEFTVEFTAGNPAMYSASLEVNTTNVILVATSVPGPALTILLPSTCSPNAGGASINFGNLQNGELHLCNFSVSNPNAQPLTISTLGVTGAFEGAQLPATPFTLAPGQAVTFVAEITPACGTTAISGAIVVNSQTFALLANGFDPLLPTPAIGFDASAFQSDQQHSVSISLPTAAACPASGYLNMTFAPAAAAVKDDSSIVFLQGSVRSLAFSVAAGQTAVSIGGQSSAMFQTGSTAGTITFTLTGAQINGGNPSTAITIPAAIITVDSATASDQILGQLDVEVIGFDNTYSAGAMTFTFFDTTGNAIGAPVNADFTQQFASYFATQSSGSAFLIRVSFPVQGDQTQVGTVEVTLTNSAGAAQTGTLTFQ